MPSRAIHSILAATDLTEASDEILRAAASLATHSAAELHVVHSFDFQSDREEGAGKGGFPDRIQTAERALDDQIGRAIPATLPVSSREVLIYIAHKEILDRAAQVSADLIVLGPHRKRPLMDHALGGTADRVIRGAEVPCLVVRAPVTPPLRRIVVSTDLSEAARGALDEALFWARTFGERGETEGSPTRLRVLHVSPLASPAVEPPVAEEIRAALARAGGAEQPRIEDEVIRGDSPADEIVRYAERERSDLLVLGTSGHGILGRALLGSATSAVSRLAPCSVLLVPRRSD